MKINSPRRKPLMAETSFHSCRFRRIWLPGDCERVADASLACSRLCDSGWQTLSAIATSSSKRPPRLPNKPWSGISCRVPFPQYLPARPIPGYFSQFIPRAHPGTSLRRRADIIFNTLSRRFKSSESESNPERSSQSRKRMLNIRCEVSDFLTSLFRSNS